MRWNLREAAPGEDDDAVTRLMTEYLVWGADRIREEYGVVEPPTDPARVRDSLAKFQPPSGLLVIAESTEPRPLGIGALRRHPGGVAEVKRMYVVPAARGLHLGSAILDRLLREAVGWGAATVRLDSCRFMTEAHALYRSRGFRERPPYPESEIPESMQRHWIFLEREMAPTTLSDRARLTRSVPAGPHAAGPARPPTPAGRPHRGGGGGGSPGRR